VVRTKPRTHSLARRFLVGAFGLLLLMPTAGALAQEIAQAPLPADELMMPGGEQMWPIDTEMALSIDDGMLDEDVMPAAYETVPAYEDMDDDD